MRTSVLTINADGRMPAMHSRKNRLISNEMAPMRAAFVSRTRDVE
jgi:hypothetical protein